MDKKIKIFQFRDEHLKDLQAILLEYMTFIANSMIKPPWNYSIDVEGEVNFTMSNLDKFKEPDGRLLLVEVDGQIAGTISMRKIREDSMEIKRMYVRTSYRGKNLGDFMIEKMVGIAKLDGFSKIYLDTANFMSAAIYLYRKLGFVETKSYPECIVPKELWNRWIFMVKAL